VLWREPYQTRISGNHLIPELDDIDSIRGGRNVSSTAVWIGGFGFNAISDQGVWWRLFQEAFPGDPCVFRAFILPKWTTKKRMEAISVVPPSEHVSSLLISDPDYHWEKLVDPDKPERGFTAIVLPGTVDLLMVGPPTEEAWDQFRERWGSLRI
jgi:hypothetical protein